MTKELEDKIITEEEYNKIVLGAIDAHQDQIRKLDVIYQQQRNQLVSSLNILYRNARDLDISKEHNRIIYYYDEKEKSVSYKEFPKHIGFE